LTKFPDELNFHDVEIIFRNMKKPMSEVQPTAALKIRNAHGGRAILSRYALVLDAVAQASRALPLAEIGERTGLPQATVYRLVHALLHVGFLAQAERRKHYAIGPRLLRMLCAAMPRGAVRQLAQPILEQLASDFGETAYISKLEGDEVETLAVALPGGEKQAFVYPGRSMPFHAAASAKAILAFADDRLVDEVLAKPRARYTAHTKTTENEIAAELATIRQQGFAVCDQELDPGVLSYACPVRIGGAGVVYALGIVGFADRLASSPLDAIVSSLRSAAETLSNAIRDDAASAPARAAGPFGGNDGGQFAAQL
jgi:DNA-binding IclR family transcriptional regulator